MDDPKEWKFYADIAASIQKVTEEVVLEIASHAKKITGCSKVCFAGGVALNSVANGRLLREGCFDYIFIQPAAGDSGGSLGAALWAWRTVLGKSDKFVMEHAYWGAEYSDDQAADYFIKENILFRELGDHELLDVVSTKLSQGKVIGGHQGRAEWGPRALGNRSILANASHSDMKEIVNSKIKFREEFRPFAPSVLLERTTDYFDMPDPEKQWPARFTLYVCSVNEDKRELLPFITHVDGSARSDGASKPEPQVLRFD